MPFQIFASHTKPLVNYFKEENAKVWDPAWLLGVTKGGNFQSKKYIADLGEKMGGQG